MGSVGNLNKPTGVADPLLESLISETREKKEKKKQRTCHDVQGIRHLALRENSSVT